MAMKVKKSTQVKAQNRVKGILISIGLVATVSIVTGISTYESQKTISVVRLKTTVSSNALITEDMLEEYPMYYKEFKNSGTLTFSDGSTRQSIVTWDKRDSIINTRYSAYMLRTGTPLYWDSTVKEQKRKNSYLYSMKGELLNIKMSTEDFGDMVVPGDRLNIRVTYETTLYDLPSEEAYKLSLASGADIQAIQTNVKEMLFSEVSVLDMLNGKGESIFDIYYSFLSKTKEAQSALMANEEFVSSIKPDTILLEATAEEAERFSDIQSKSPEYLMTLLPRTSSNAILDSLSDAQKAVSNASK